jgi:hypothetical protein
MLRLLLVCGILASVVAAAAAMSAATATGPATIRVTDEQSRLVVVDIGARGRSPGDMEIVTARVYNRRIRDRAIGHWELLCTFTIGVRRTCRGTVFLPKGKLVVGGSIRYRELYELAILGGTGLYNNARGTLTVTRLQRKPRRQFLYFRLAG